MQVIESSQSVRPKPRPSPIQRVTVVGGGNVGSSCVSPLARELKNQRLTIVDHDRYENKNLRCQDIVADDVGRNKAEVQAGQARRIRPDLRVDAFPHPIEHLPLGRLIGGLIVCATDSRRSRQTVNRMAMRMGICWIDAGVDAAAGQLRINVYDPSRTACLECGWSDADYAAVEQRYACGAGDSVSATNGSASLGKVAGGLAASEVRKLLAGEPLVDASHWFLDVRHHVSLASRLQRDQRCRCDHRQWMIEPSPLDLQATVGQLRDRGAGATHLWMEGQRFLPAASCCACGALCAPVLMRAAESQGGSLPCGECGTSRVVRGFDLLDRLPLQPVNGALRLSHLGLVADDVLCLGNAGHERFVRVQGESHE